MSVGDKDSEVEKMKESKGIPIDLKRLLTGLVGVGIVAVVGFLVTSWNLANDVEDLQQMVQSTDQKMDAFVTHSDAEKIERDAIHSAESYTDTKVSELKITLAQMASQQSTTQETLRELKGDLHDTSKDNRDQMRALREDVSSIKLSIERRQ